jgi:hypothetical protein
MSSFTFSSEPDVEECVSDDRISIWTLVFIIVSMALGYFLSQYIYSLHTVGVWELKNDTNWKQLELIVVGDSSEQAAIKAELFENSAVNISVPGSGYSAWLPVFRGGLSRSSSVRVVVMSCDPMSRLRDGLTPRGDDLSDLVLRGAKSSDLDTISRIARFETFLRYETFLATVLSKPKASWVDLTRWLTAGGFIQPKSAFKFTPEQGFFKKRDYFDFFEKKHCIDANEQAFLEMLSIVKEQGMQLILVRTPVTREFQLEGAVEWESHYDWIVKTAKSKLGESNIEIFDGSMMFADDLTKFRDPNHVNASGREVFTERLNDFIQSSFTVSPKTTK